MRPHYACLLIVPVLCLLNIRTTLGEITMCKHYLDCPDDEFCDDRAGLCSVCLADVCSQLKTNADTCLKFCPRYYAKLMATTTTETPTTTKKYDSGVVSPAMIKRNKTTSDSSGSGLGVLVSVVLFGVSVMLLTGVGIVVFWGCRYNFRCHRQPDPEHGSPSLTSERRCPVTEDPNPHTHTSQVSLPQQKYMNQSNDEAKPCELDKLMETRL